MSTFVYSVTIVHMADEFKTKTISNYANCYLKIIDFIIANNELNLYATSFSYVFKWDFLYYKNSEKGLRFCIFDNMTKKVFEQTHDQSRHFGFAATHEKIIEGLYIFKLLKKLRDYIRNCPQCELNQTSHHSFYETLQSIINFSKSFHIITIDFIIVLFKSKKNKFDCVMSMTDKFSKTVIFITNYIAKSNKWWAIELFNRFTLVNWELFYAIISDQDLRFIEQIWKQIFETLKIFLNYSTVYHPQTDGMFECTNQTAKIALHYWITTLISIDEWSSILLRMQLTLNNSTKYSSTLQTPAQMLYGFRLKKPLDFMRINDHQNENNENALANVNHQNINSHLRMINTNSVIIQSINKFFAKSAHKHLNIKNNSQNISNIAVINWFSRTNVLSFVIMNDYKFSIINVKNAITFVFIHMKKYYDCEHVLMFFNTNDYINIRFHREYSLSGISNFKLNQQFVEFFWITKWINNFAYQLNLFVIWRIHNVLFITHFEFTISFNDDFYSKPRFDHLFAIIVDEESKWEIERLLAKKQSGRSSQYLVRWK